MAFSLDSAIDSIASVADIASSTYTSYTQATTQQQVANQQAEALFQTNQAQNTALVNNSKMWLIGGIILAIGTALFLFNRK